MPKKKLKARAGQIVLTVPGKMSVTNPEKLPTEGQLGKVRELAESAPGMVTWATQIREDEFYIRLFTTEETQEMFDAGDV